MSFGTHCKACGQVLVVVEDEAHGISVCGSCGYTLEASVFSNDVTFGKDAGGESTVMGQYVNESGVARGAGRVHGGRVYGGAADPSDKAAGKGRAEISRLADALGVRPRDQMVEGAVRLYRIALLKEFTRGRRTSCVAAACLYTVCRQENKPFLLLDFSDALQVNLFVLGGVYLSLTRILRLADDPTLLRPVDPSLYLDRFSEKLFKEDQAAREAAEAAEEATRRAAGDAAGEGGGGGAGRAALRNLRRDRNALPRAAARTALRLVASMKRDWIATGRRPAGVCGAALYVAAAVHGAPKTRRQVMRVVHVGEFTLSRRLLEFAGTDAAALPIAGLGRALRERDRRDGLAELRAIDGVAGDADGAYGFESDQDDDARAALGPGPGSGGAGATPPPGAVPRDAPGAATPGGPDELAIVPVGEGGSPPSLETPPPSFLAAPSDTVGGGCPHVRQGAPHMAHGMCEGCYRGFVQMSGGLGSGADPPAFRRAREAEMREEAERQRRILEGAGLGSQELASAEDEEARELEGELAELDAALRQPALRPFLEALEGRRAAGEPGGWDAEDDAARPGGGGEPECEDAPAPSAPRPATAGPPGPSSGPGNDADEGERDALPTAAALALARARARRERQRQEEARRRELAAAATGAGGAEAGARAPAGGAAGGAGDGGAAPSHSQLLLSAQLLAANPPRPLPPPPPLPEDWNLEGEGGLSDLSDDEELTGYLADPGEIAVKEQIWNLMNADWIEKQAQKARRLEAQEEEARELREREEEATRAGVAFKRARGRPAGSKTRSREEEMAAVAAGLPANLSGAAAGTARALAGARLGKKLSTKINYKALGNLFPIEGVEEEEEEGDALAAAEAASAAAARAAARAAAEAFGGDPSAYVDDDADAARGAPGSSLLHPAGLNLALPSHGVPHLRTDAAPTPTHAGRGAASTRHPGSAAATPRQAAQTPRHSLHASRGSTPVSALAGSSPAAASRPGGRPRLASLSSPSALGAVRGIGLRGASPRTLKKARLTG